VRLFVAVEIEAAAARQVAAMQDELRRRAAALAPSSRITWVPPERLHLTVRFIGEVDEPRAATLAAALQPPLSIEPFDLAVSGVGAFPGSGLVRVVWVGLSGAIDALHAVEHEVSARLAECGVPREDRAYRPHLTLARVREAGGLRAKPLLEGFETRQFGRSRVDAITLFQSRLSPKGPTYVVLQQTSLGRA
jgi:2'-5' RNA ligase